MNDRDALIKRMKAAVPEDRTYTYSILSEDLRALISLASPSPAQTETECAENAHSPAQWPEDVVERVAKAKHDALLARYPKDGLPWERMTARYREGQCFSMRAALATLPPPEDERVKGLIDALEDLSRGEDFPECSCPSCVTQRRARSALASYRGLEWQLFIATSSTTNSANTPTAP